MSYKVSSLIAAGLVICSGAGCKKVPAEDTNVIKAAQSQPGAAEVMAAVDKKDFEGVLTALTKVRDQVTTDEQNVQFLLLARQAREKITEGVLR